MAVFVDPKTGERFENVPDEEAERARSEFGLVTPEEHQLQAERGGIGSQLATVAETAIATPIETIASLGSKAAGAIQDVTGIGTAPGLTDGDAQVGSAGANTARAIAGATGIPIDEPFSDAATERREANPTAATIGAAIPDIATGVLIPGAGLAGLAASATASGLMSEGAESLIQGDEYSLADAGLYIGTGFALEGIGTLALKGAMKAKGLVKNHLDVAVDRAQGEGVQAALKETDPTRAPEMLRRNAEPLYDLHQAELDDALGVIETRLTEAPESLFKPSVLRKTVSGNQNVQQEAALNLAAGLDQARQVADAPPELGEIVEFLFEATEGTGAEMFDALRQARREVADLGVDSPMVADALEAMDASLRHQPTWGKAAKDYDQVASEAAFEGADSGVFDVRDLAGREGLDGRLERARATAKATGDKKLAEAVAKAERAVAGADRVTGAKVMGGGSAPEIDAMRAKVTAFDDRVAPLADEMREALEGLEEMMDGDLTDLATNYKRVAKIVPTDADSLAKQSAFRGTVADGADTLRAQLGQGAAAQTKHDVGLDEFLSTYPDRNARAQVAEEVRDAIAERLDEYGAKAVEGDPRWSTVEREIVGERLTRMGVNPAPAKLSDVAEALSAPGVKTWTKTLDSTLQAMSKSAREAKTTEEIFRSIYQGKQSLQKLVKRMGQSLTQTAGLAERQGLEMLQEMTERFQDETLQGLYRREVWGDAADFMSGVNKALHKKVIPASNAVAQDFQRLLGRDYRTNKPIGTFAPEKIRAHIAARMQGSTTADEQLKLMLSGAEDVIATQRKWGTADARQLALAEKRIATVRKALAEVDEIPVARRRIRDYDAKPQSLTDRLLAKGGAKLASRAISGAAGFVAGGPIGGMVGAMAGDAVEPLVEKAIRAGRRAANDGSEAMQRAQALLARRQGQTGAVFIGGKGGSPVDLSGKSLKDLGALDDPTTFKAETLEALRTGKGGAKDFAEGFGASGRVRQTGQVEQGIQIEMGPKGPRLVDGRHRLMVGREKGLTEVYGQVYDGARAPGKKPIYEGPIPIAKGGGVSRPRFASLAKTESLKDAANHNLAGYYRKHISPDLAHNGRDLQSVDVDSLEGAAKQKLADRFGDDADSLGPASAALNEHMGFMRENARLTRGLPEPKPASEANLPTGAVDLSDQEKAAIKRFTFESFKDVKAAQRGEAVGNASVMGDLPVLDEAIRKLGVAPEGTLFRGIKLDDAGLNEILKADSLSEPVILSTSTKEATARGFATGGDPGLRPILLRYSGVRGAAPVMGDLSATPGANEVLLPRNAHFRVKGRFYDPSRKMHVIDLEQVAPSGKGGERGFAATGEGVRNILTSPIGLTAGAGLAAAGVHQLATPEQQEAQDRAERVDGTRQKLGFLATQGRTTVAVTARAMANPVKTERTVPTVPGVTSSSGVADFMGNQDTLRSAYDAKRETLLKLEQDPMLLVDELTDGLGELADSAPELHAKLTAQTFKVVQFLQSKLPATIGASLSRPEGTPPNMLAVKQFALYYSAATQPATVLRDLANNRARREQVDTLRELWPDTYQGLKSQVIGEMSQQRPTVAQRLRLDLLFDFGDALDAGLSNRLMVLANRPPKEQAPGEQKGAPSRKTQPSVTGTSPTSSLNRGAVSPLA